MKKLINLGDPIISGHLSLIKKLILQRLTRVQKDSRIVFTCGAAEPKDYTDTVRSLLMNYAKKHLPSYNFFMAEKLFDSLEDKSSKDLLSIEKQLTNYSDCIIIILESESSFTELGAFSVDNELAKKILVLNESKYSKESSFINLGPIKKINDLSKFGEVINTDFARAGQSFNIIEEKLKEIKDKRVRDIDISSFDLFKTKDKIRFYLIHDLISMFFPISNSEIIAVLKYFFGDNDYKIQFDLALLKSLGFITQINDYYVKTPMSKDQFLSFKGANYRTIRIDLINYYKKHDRRLEKAFSTYEHKAA